VVEYKALTRVAAAEGVVETVRQSTLAAQVSGRVVAVVVKAGDTVKAGDSLSKIAKRVYGDAQQWRKIYESNRAVIGDNPDLIHPGQALKLPRA
jgi:nucleoid-associated protein YgaU